MDQTLDCIWKAQQEPELKEKILSCVKAGKICTIIVDRHKLIFDSEAHMVTITKMSDTVPFARKIVGCRIPYPVLQRVLIGDWSDMTGMQWL